MTDSERKDICQQLQAKRDDGINEINRMLDRHHGNLSVAEYTWFKHMDGIVDGLNQARQLIENYEEKEETV